MSLPIITADQRLATPRGIKGCIFGKSGIGKTSLLWTLDPATTLFMDLEAGDLAIKGWQGDTIRPRSIVTRPYSLTRSPWPVGCAFSGARASPRRFRTKPANRMCAGHMVCTAAR